MFNRLKILLLITFTSVFVAANTAWAAQTPMELAQSAADDLDQAAKALQKAQESDDRVSALSQTVLAYENGLLAVRQSLRSATIREQVLRLEFASQRNQISKLLGVLQTIERASSPMLMIHPSGPAGTARSGMIMSEVTPTLQRRANELRAQLQEIHALSDMQKNAETELEKGLSGAQDARIALATAIRERTELPLRFAADPVRVQILADNSKTLNFFANGLTDIPLKQNDARPFSINDHKGSLPLPVSGTLLRAYNESDAAGIRRPGIVISTRPLSLITSPTPATVRFAGTFLDYGKVIILEIEPKLLMVIANLDQIYVEFGQIVNLNEPIGLLGGKQPEVQDFLIEASEGRGAIGQETLYIEIRKDGKPVDPTDWFALSNI